VQRNRTAQLSNAQHRRGSNRERRADRMRGAMERARVTA